jgi:hypothetical protein
VAKRHFLQQAHKFAKGKHLVKGAWASEKLDGQRCYWDGGFSRGIPKTEVPFANQTGDYRYLVPPISTGLWSRYGNIIHAPSWFLDLLPPFPCDGELWCGRGLHQTTRKIISPLIPNELEWRKVKFIVFDTPAYSEVFYDSIIDIPNFSKRLVGCLDWLPPDHIRRGQSYVSRYEYLLSNIKPHNNISIIDQIPLKSEETLEEFLDEIMDLGGEGVVIRNHLARYIAERDHSLAKVKPYHDDEAVVVGYVTGRETDKGSKLLGMMGAMIVEWKGKRFELSGFTDGERTLNTVPGQRINAYNWACENPETICPSHIEAVHFPRGSKVTFKYRELTDEGIPKEASYLRKYEAV